VCTSCEVGSWERRMVRVPHMRLCRVVPWAWCAQATTWCGVGWAYFYHLGPPVQHAEKVWRACLRSQTDAFEKQASRIEPVLISLRSRTNVRLQHLLGCAGESGFGGTSDACMWHLHGCADKSGFLGAQGSYVTTERLHNIHIRHWLWSMTSSNSLWVRMSGSSASDAWPVSRYISGFTESMVSNVLSRINMFVRANRSHVHISIVINIVLTF